LGFSSLNGRRDTLFFNAFRQSKYFEESLAEGSPVLQY
jgi:hypothetical protein